MIIDSHCHLSYKNDYSNIDNILERANDVGVIKFLNIATKYNEFETLKHISNVYKDIYFTLGIHPHEANETSNEIINEIKENSENEKFLGIGETGLDFYYNNSDRYSQIKSFKNHIEASQLLQIPLIVHSRNAEDETFEILNAYMKKKKIKILMHCFSGSTSFAKKMQSLDAFFSASGIITFKNSLNLQSTFSEIPLDKLLIETDSPFLAPVPMRGKKNEPSFIKYTLEKLSKIKNVNKLELDKITTNNFNRLFFN
mgnify:CR=1 FL=1